MTWQEARTEEQNAALRDLITFLEAVGPALEEGVGQHEQDHFILPPGLIDLEGEDREKTPVGTEFLVDDENLCGTTGCAAGWTCIQAGYKFRWIMAEDDYGYKHFKMEIQAPGSDTWRKEYGDEVVGYWSFEETAANLLGFTERQSADIFYTWDEPTAIQKLKNVLDGTWEWPEYEEAEDEYGE
jgi:hypothetical protein